MHNLFVYGILKDGTGRVAWVRGDLFDLGGCPGVRRVDDPRAAWVKGELHEVDDPLLAHFDRVEGSPHLYRRIRARVFDEKDGNHFADAWIYEFNREPDSDMRCGDEWPRRGYE